MNRPDWRFTDAAHSLKLTDSETRLFLFHILGAMDVAEQIDEAAYGRAVAYILRERLRK